VERHFCALRDSLANSLNSVALDLDLERELAGLDDDNEMEEILYGRQAKKEPEKNSVKALQRVRPSRVCVYCHETINGRSVIWNNQYFHPEHFICNQCLAPLQGESFLDVDGRKYCEKVSDPFATSR
jgi:hypothetical protein